MTTPYSEPAQGQWYQFDPNVHYYYDEQGRVHYYDPNTNLDCDYQPDYPQQQHASVHQGNGHYNQQQTYTPRQSLDSPYAEVSPSRQGTPDVLLPCPESTCNGENKPTAKFCEECGRSLGGISRSATPATTHNANITPLTRAFSNQHIQDNYHPQQTQEHLYQPPQPPLQRPPTAPVYSSNALDAQTVPLYHPSSTGSTIDPSRQHLHYNGVQHQSMQDLYGMQQQQQTAATTPRQYNPSNVQQKQQQHYNNNMAAPANNYQPSARVDPLDRARGCPIVSFGFGGKMFTTFPRTVTDYYSSTVKPQPGPIKVKYLKDINNKSALAPHVSGPVLFDSKVGTKQKKKDVGQYITQMVATFEKQKETIAVNSVEYHQLQAKILLYQLIKNLVSIEGNMNDKDKTHQAILSVLRPTIADLEESHFSLPSYTTDTNPQNVDLSDQMLSKIEQFLLNSDRKGAVDYAIQEDLWAHALIISSTVDKDLWQMVIKNFVDREMNASPEMRQNRTFNNIAGNNQALRVIYSLFSGAGPASMKEFIVSDIQHVNTPYGLKTTTPQVDLSQLIKWRDTLAIILANRSARDFEALTALGDIMKEQGWIEAAHICYLLSPQSSVHSGVDTMQVRLTLVGSDQPSLETLTLSEIFEFAYTLNTANSATCLPFLQGYKLIHAWILADYGLIDIATRYFESIDHCIKSYTKTSPYFHPQLIEQVAALGVYLENASGKKNGVDPGSWLKPKFQKKAFSSLWGTLEGSLTKFVSGEEVQSQEPAPARKSTEIMSRFS